MAEPLVLKDQTGESQVFFDRVAIGALCIILLTLALVARLFYLQVVQHEMYSTLSDQNRIQVQPLPPSRGLIYDSRGALIADNVPSFSLTMTVERVASVDETLAELDTLIGLTSDEVVAFRKRLKRGRRPFESVPILFKLSHEEIATASVNRYRLPGISIEAKLVRHYPTGDLMVHAVGSVRRINEEDASRLDRVAYSGTDHIGKIGVERFYESALLGGVGYQRVETDARGRIMQVLDSTPPKPGDNLVLYLDSSLQQAASDALGQRRGAVVALDPKTGGILAMVSKPAYDPNLFVSGINSEVYAALRDSPDVPLFNRALQGQYTPGSTIKPFMGLAGLATGVINAAYTIEDPGYFRLPNSSRLYRDWNWKISGAGGHGSVNIEKAIYRSCNVYFYGLAVKLGIDRIDQYLSQFGFGEDTVLDLPEARAGLLPSREWKRSARSDAWYPGDTVNMGIGQGDILVTPLQLATAVAIIANRGKMVTPRMLKSGSDLVNHSSTRALKNIDSISDANWKLIIDSMVKVVHRGNQGYGENGTAWVYIGRDIPYQMAGKSGTAQVVGIAQGEQYKAEDLDEYQRKHAWFIAFAPVEDPVIAIAVLIENGGGGSEMAAPIARQVIDHYLLGSDRIRLAGASQ